MIGRWQLNAIYFGMLKINAYFSKLSTGENAFSFIDSTLWNKILKETKRTIYINTFKHNLKKFYLKKLVSQIFEKNCRY